MNNNHQNARLMSCDALHFEVWGFVQDARTTRTETIVKCMGLKIVETINFGNFLRNYREIVGYGLREFANLIGVTASTLSAIELGQRNPADDFDLRAVALHLGIKQGTADWNKLFDLAARGKQAPKDVTESLSATEYGPQLISLLRTIERQRPDAKMIEELHKHLDSMLKATVRE